MPNSYREWQKFQFAQNNLYGFFFLHNLPSTIVFKFGYALFDIFYAEISIFSIKKYSVRLLSTTSWRYERGRPTSPSIRRKYPERVKIAKTLSDMQANFISFLLLQLQHRVIDNTIGAVFEIEVTDVNNDGRDDLLVSTNGNNGTVLVYEIPDDFRTGTYKKHVIAVGFTPRLHITGKGAPGNVFAARPNTLAKGWVFMDFH